MRSVDELVLSIQDRISLPILEDDRFNKAAVIRILNEVNQEQIAPFY